MRKGVREVSGAANIMERGCKALTLDPTTKGVARIIFRSLKRLNTFSYSNFLQDCQNKGKERYIYKGKK